MCPKMRRVYSMHVDSFLLLASIIAQMRKHHFPFINTSIRVLKYFQVISNPRILVFHIKQTPLKPSAVLSTYIIIYTKMLDFMWVG